jgi:hypothetical protein
MHIAPINKILAIQKPITQDKTIDKNAGKLLDNLISE